MRLPAKSRASSRGQTPAFEAPDNEDSPAGRASPDAPRRFYGGRPRPRRLSLALFLLAGGAGGGAFSAGQTPTVANLQVITSAHQAHSPASAQAKEVHSVHFKAVVSYYDPMVDQRHGALFVRHSSRAVFAALPAVVVPQRASWWSPSHALLFVTLVLAGTFVVGGWVVVLRKRVEKQTAVIRGGEERFNHMVQHDALTGLPSPKLLEERLTAALERAKRYRSGIALLMMDIDNFKLINDSYGRRGGDEALRATARRIVGVVRGTDTVARMGGDEFIVLLTDLNDLREAESIAVNILAAMELPVTLGERNVPITVSVGICCDSGGVMAAEDLLKSVDTAMHHAKAQGRNCFQLFTPEMARANAEKLRLQAGLRRAIELDELELYYQPMVNCHTGTLTGFEALLRWRSKTMGMIMPGDFIPLAEESGLIVPIGEWVVREACRQMGELERKLGRSFMLGVNLSPRQFQQQNLPRMIEQALAEQGRLPQCIELEITESLLMTDSPKTHKALMQLRDLGAQLAIDDFGIGFSSLSYITRFSIDRIKIDRSFVQNCCTVASSLAVIRAIVAMAHGLNIQVVAEGVETGEQFSTLREERCDTAQGYYFSRPVPRHELPALIAAIEGSSPLHLGTGLPHKPLPALR